QPANTTLPHDSPRNESSAASRLIRAAGPVLARRGFDKATVREIASIADVNVAAVSYHFGDKMGLYRAVLVDIRRTRERQYPTPQLDSSDPESTLLAIVWTLLSRMLRGKESGWESQLMMREIHQPTAVLREMIQDYFRPLYETLCRTIELLIETDHHANFVAERSLASDQPVAACESGSAETISQALIPQIAFGVVGQCHHHMIAQPVIEQLIDEATRRDHFDLESICRQITASTLAACGQENIVQHLQRLNCMPLAASEPCLSSSSLNEQ
ncbi:MAG: CerR family C-terminal domain-containing protein, partial [Planctomycetota bacterium]